MVDKKSLSERDICTQYITPAIIGAGWDLIREEVSVTKGNSTAKYFQEEPCVGGRGSKIAFKSDSDKTQFAKEVVPKI